MSSQYYFKEWNVTLDDGNGNTLQFRALSIKWPLATDDFIVIEFPTRELSIEQRSLLDEWEANGTQLNVTIEPICYTEDAPPERVECPEDISDYDSMEGIAVIKDLRNCIVDENGNQVCGGWVYVPESVRGAISEIPLLFIQAEE